MLTGVGSTKDSSGPVIGAMQIFDDWVQSLQHFLIRKSGEVLSCSKNLNRQDTKAVSQFNGRRDKSVVVLSRLVKKVS